MAMKKDPRMSEPLEERGPGAHLRDAREKAGMTVEAVAASLLLAPKTLELLEADAYARLPAPAFVRGYLRGYARVLGLPSGPILEMYDRQGFEPPPLNTDTTESTQAHASDTPVRLITYAIVVVLVLLVGLWWHSQEEGGFGIGSGLFDGSRDADHGESDLTAEGPGMSPDASDGGGAPWAMASDRVDDPLRDNRPAAAPHVGEAEPGDHDSADVALAGTRIGGEPLAMPSLQPDTAPGDVESALASPHEGDAADSVRADPVRADTGTERAPLATDGESAATREARPEAAAASERGDGAIPGAGGEDAPAAEPPGEPAPQREGAGPIIPADSTTVADSAPSGLVLEFAHESWVEVYDRERVRLFFDLVQPGKVLEFEGPQPFDVLLGYAKDVRVTIDGEAFDLKPHLKHGVARFSVGSESAGGTSVAESGGATAPDATDSPAQPVPAADRGG